MREDDLKFMPRTQEALVAQGATFENAFVTDPLCCPSRVTVLTGQYAHNHGVKTKTAPNGGFAALYDSGVESRTVATRLKAAGYKTGFFGKYLNGYCNPKAGCDAPERRSYVPPGWSEWHAWSGGRTMNHNGELETFTDDPLLKDDITRQLAGRFIRNSGYRAFFMHVSERALHSDNDVAPRHEGMFADERAPRRAS